jgi:D-threonate/D-erythronate kinase
MLLVLADDFSGAAEIGGIGYRYGLNTEVQLIFDDKTNADLVILDTDTRSVSEEEAVRKMKDICLSLKSSHRPIKLFKKIDSVLRGHIIPEINLLLYHFRFERILLLPANPGKGRTITDGCYFVNETPLVETVFAKDPHFPIHTSDVSLMVNEKAPALGHVHVRPYDKLPSNALITGDVSSKDDLKKYLKGSTPRDFCCGGAELFEAYLENLGKSATVEPKGNSVLSASTLIVNGSTIRNNSEDALFERLAINRFSLPGRIEDDQYFLDSDHATQWYQAIVESLNTNRIAAVSIDHPIHPGKNLSGIFLSHLIKMIEYLTGCVNINNVHWCITGGATASAMIRHAALETMQVKEEVAPGVVTLAHVDANNNEIFLTVKPGSYWWPESWIELLSKNRKS